MAGAIAQAFVEILPVVNQAQFTAQLEAQLAAAVAATKLPSVQAQAAVTTSAADLAAKQREGVIAEQNAARITTQTKAQNALTRANQLGADAQFKLVSIQEAAIGAGTELAAAQRIFTASQGATAAASRAVTAAFQTQDVAVQENTKTLLVQAQAAEAAALQNLNLARTAVDEGRAAQVQAARHAQLARGIGASTATFAGLRGATLAASAPFIAGTVAVIAFSKALGSAVGLQTQLNVFKETAGATADEMNRVAAASRQLGADITLPAVSAGDAAQAMTELAKAGLSVEDSISGARGVLQLATAANIDVAQAVELSASALNAFGLAGTDAVHVADLFANAANEAQGSISDMGLALQQTAAVAKQVGLSLDDTTAILTLLAKNGLRGSDAGTSLRTALIRLVAPTQQANEVIQSLGLTIRDAQGNVRPDVFAQFGRATADLSPNLRDAAAAAIFGQDAIRAVAIAAREGTAGLNEAQQALDRQGSAAALAAARTQGLAGQASALQSNLDTLGGTLAGKLIPALTEFVHEANDLVNALAFVARGFQIGTVEAARFAQSLPGGDKLEGLAKALFRFQPSHAVFEAAAVAADHFKSSQDKAAESLTKSLAAAQKLRAELVQQDAPIEQLRALDAQITKLAQDLQAAQQGVVRQPTVAPADQTQQALQNALKLQKQLSGTGIDTSGIDALILKLQNQLPAAAGAAGLAIEDLRGTVDRALAFGPGTTPFDPESIRTNAKQVSDHVHELATNLRADLEKLKGLDPTSEFAQNTRADVDALIDQLKRVGPEGSAVLRAQAAQLAPVLGDTLRSALGDITGVDLARQTGISDAIKGQIAALAASRPGRAELRSIGSQLMDSLADGIKSNDSAVTAARQALSDAVQAAHDATLDAIRSARTNLESIGNALQQQIDQLIDAGPIQRQIDKINEALDALQERTSRRQLRFDLTKAKQDLRDAQEAVSQVGQVTPREAQARREFLQPFEQAVGDANAKLKEFDLTETKNKLEENKAAAKKAAEDGVFKLVQAFEQGKITAGKFAALLKDQLAPQLRDLPKTNLGLTFTTGFLRNVRDLVAQAQALTGFVGVAGTAPGATIGRPAVVAEQGQARIDAAQANLTKALQAQQDTAKNTDEIHTVLVEIRNALTGRGGTPTTKTKPQPAIGGSR